MKENRRVATNARIAVAVITAGLLSAAVGCSWEGEAAVPFGTADVDDVRQPPVPDVVDNGQVGADDPTAPADVGEQADAACPDAGDGQEEAADSSAPDAGEQADAACPDAGGDLLPDPPGEEECDWQQTEQVCCQEGGEPCRFAGWVGQPTPDTDGIPLMSGVLDPGVCILPVSGPAAEAVCSVTEEGGGHLVGACPLPAGGVGVAHDHKCAEAAE